MNQTELAARFEAETARMKLIIEHRRIIYEEIKAAFGWRWRRPSPRITAMLCDHAEEQKLRKAEWLRQQAEEAARREAKQAMEKRRAKLLRYRHRKPLDWLLAGRLLIKELQRDFIPDSQHWPLVQLWPDGLTWLDQRFRAMVRRDAALRGP